MLGSARSAAGIRALARMVWIVVLASLVSLTAGPLTVRTAMADDGASSCACPCCEEHCEDEIRRAPCCEQAPAPDASPTAAVASPSASACVHAPRPSVPSHVPTRVAGPGRVQLHRWSTGPPLWLQQRSLLL